ncbi:MAG: nucleoside deaminase [Acidobacteriota bacterium]
MRNSTDPTDLSWMRAALRAAREAGRAGEIPVGVVIVDRQGQRVASGSNRTLRDSDPTAHAEIVALRRAARRIGNHRLTGLSVYCTLEPCPMCVGALVQARVKRLIYGADDEKGGGISHGHHKSSAFNHRFKFSRGLLESESACLLREFFASRRASAQKT